eukprot:scaffold16712_cov65-Phaeocystis_antarctica.AAC.19
MEHSDGLALLDDLARHDDCLAGGDLGHTNRHEAHQANVGIFGLDVDGHAGGDGRQELLAVVRSERIRVPGSKRFLLGQELCLKARVDVLKVVGARNLDDFDDSSGDGRKPVVVRECGEIGLVDTSPDEGASELVAMQHVVQRVLLALEPELAVSAHVAPDRERRGLARVDDHRVVVGAVVWPRLVPTEAVERTRAKAHRVSHVREGPKEELVPVGEAIILLVRRVGEFERSKVGSTCLAPFFGLQKYTRPSSMVTSVSLPTKLNATATICFFAPSWSHPTELRGRPVSALAFGGST